MRDIAPRRWTLWKPLVLAALVSVAVRSPGTTFGPVPMDRNPRLVGISESGVSTIVDSIGDANFGNGQGLASGNENGMDSRPASFGNADLLSVTVTEEVDRSLVRDSHGGVAGVTFKVVRFGISMVTALPAQPTPGPTVLFRIALGVAPCAATFDLYIKGSLSSASDPEGAWAIYFCPNKLFTTVRGSVDFSGTTTRMRFSLPDPYNLLSKGRLIHGWSAGTLLTGQVVPPAPPPVFLSSPSLTPLVIDETTRGGEFRIGDGVPPDATCPDVAVPECGSATPVPQCSILGTPGKDVLVGTGASDVICGFGGADRIHAGGGDDTVLSGPGRDRIHAGGGDDTVLGGPGRDRIWGGRGNDWLVGGPGRDRLAGGRGTDACKGSTREKRGCER